MKLDLGSMQSVKQFAAEFAAKSLPLQLNLAYLKLWGRKREANRQGDQQTSLHHFSECNYKKL